MGKAKGSVRTDRRSSHQRSFCFAKQSDRKTRQAPSTSYSRCDSRPSGNCARKTCIRRKACALGYREETLWGATAGFVDTCGRVDVGVRRLSTYRILRGQAYHVSGSQVPYRPSSLDLRDNLTREQESLPRKIARPFNDRYGFRYLLGRNTRWRTNSAVTFALPFVEPSEPTVFYRMPSNTYRAYGGVGYAFS